MKTSGVTLRLNVKYKKAVLCNLGNILLRAKIRETKKNICLVRAELVNVLQMIYKINASTVIKN